MEQIEQKTAEPNFEQMAQQQIEAANARAELEQQEAEQRKTLAAEMLAASTAMQDDAKTAPTEPPPADLAEPPPEPVPAKPPIRGLVPGRIVHVLDKGKLKAAIVADVHDDCEGDITARVQETTGPTTARRLLWSGDGAPLAEGGWQWPR